MQLETGGLGLGIGAGVDEDESGLLDCPALHDAGGVGQAIRSVFACIEVPIREPGELVA